EPGGPEPGAAGTGSESATGPSVAATGPTAGPTAAAKPRKAGRRKYGQLALIIADGVIDAIRRDGGDLLLTEGELHFYRDGLWSPADDALEQRLRVLIQQGADALHEADTRILSAAWKRLMEHPALYRAHVDWDAAGKVGLTNGVDWRTVRQGSDGSAGASQCANSQLHNLCVTTGPAPISPVISIACRHSVSA